jgi:hypothetical protein
MRMAYLGLRARVSEVLNQRRPLSLAMIRRLQAGLGLPADVLVQPYALQAGAAPAQSLQRIPGWNGFNPPSGKGAPPRVETPVS